MMHKNKIQAIKHVRDTTKMNLLECQLLVEAIMPFLTETTAEHLQRMERNTYNACAEFYSVACGHSTAEAKKYLALCERLETIREFIKLETEHAK